MKHGSKVAICLAGGLAWQFSAGAVTSDGQLNPYSAIVDRNVFNLKPVPPPPPPPPGPETQPTKITLLGIVSGFGPKQVMFKTPVGTPPKEMSFALGEGERAEDFEVIEINEIAGSVRIRNHGQEEALTLEKHGMKPTASAPAIPGVPGVPRPGAPRIPPPIPTPGRPVTSGIPAPTGGSTVTTFGSGTTTPTRPLRVSTSGTPGVTGIAGRATTQTQPQQPALTPEQSALILEANRATHQRGIDEGLVPPLPPPHPMLPK
jgi:hypothetical protein